VEINVNEKVEKAREKVLLLKEDHNFLFKLGLSLVTAVIVALTIIYAGMAEQVRFGTLFSRALTGFMLSGTGLFLFTWWLDGYGIALYVRKDKELEKVWLAAGENAGETLEALDIKLNEAELQEETLSEEPDNQDIQESEPAEKQLTSNEVEAAQAG